MKKHFQLYIILASFLTAVSPVYPISFGSNLDSALKQGKSSNKPVMIVFYMDGCHWCDKLENDTLSDSKVSSLSSKFVCARIDGIRDRAASGKFGVRGYPNIIFANGDGKELNRISGYVGPDDFRATMEKALAAFKPLAGSKKEPVKAKVSEKAAKPSAQKKNSDGIMKKVADKVTKIAQANGQFDITGILKTPTEYKAIINNKIVAAGDTVDGAKVENIAQHTVKLKYKKKEINLYLPE